MPNIIPPIVSSSPPPLDPVEDDDDNDDDENDDFGDFTAADFASHNDLSTHKSIPDTSWTLPSSKPSLDTPVEHENGVIPHIASAEDGLMKSQVEGGDDDDISQNADNTSHDSVVSTVTDSGHGSASQNSSGTSPMPNVEIEYETSPKLLVCHTHLNGIEGQLASEISSSSVLLSSCMATDSSQSFSNVSDIEELNHRTIHSENEICAADSTQQNSCEFDNTSNPVSTKNCDKTMQELVVEDVLKSRCQSDQESKQDDSTSSTGKDAPYNGPVPVSVVYSNNANTDEFDDSISREPIDIKKGRGSDEWNDLQFSTTSSSCVLQPGCEDLLPNSVIEHEENECVRAMIIPEMPGSDDDNDDCVDIDDEFGDFSGMASSNTQNSDTIHKENLFDSPSRRPTLVLADDTDGVDESEPAEVLDTFSGLSRKKSSAAIEENDASPFPFQPVNSEDLGQDKFANFAQAEDDKDSVSDVWAQATQASAFESNILPVDSLEFDEFDDFESAEFQSAVVSKEELPPRPLFDLQEIQASLDTLLKENFPVADRGCSFSDMDSISNGLSGIALDVEDSSIWQGLRDMEATPSLSFQWPGSHSNRGLLGALNIDSRNILFGPKWNTVVPRFAANLGFSPLEPVRAVQNQPPSEPTARTEIIQPQAEETVKATPEKGFQEMVPAAQFDWSDSGLINPLDSTKDPINGPLATTTASGNPVLTSTPLQVEQLLANSKRSTPVSSLDKKGRDPSLSPEAVRVLDTLPELAFLSARMLMFPVQGDRNENKL